MGGGKFKKSKTTIIDNNKTINYMVGRSPGESDMYYWVQYVIFVQYIQNMVRKTFCPPLTEVKNFYVVE